MHKIALKNSTLSNWAPVEPPHHDKVAEQYGCIYIYIYRYGRMYVCVHVRMHIYMYVCMYLYMYVCMYIHIYIYTYIYILDH